MLLNTLFILLLIAIFSYLNQGKMDPLLPTIITTLGTCLLAARLTYNVWQERINHHAQPYEHNDNIHVHNAIWAHMNIVESMVMYLPVLWIASIYSSPLLAGMVWIIWLLSRIIYAWIYLRTPEKRMVPFITSIVCFFVTLFIAVYGLIF